MFWDKSYTPSQNIEALLEKENSTVEEFLDDEDILQECKTQKKSIINYFTRPDVIKRLVELIITEPSEELPMALRFRHANMACEILTLGLPSLDEKLLSDADTLKTLYSYLENEPPLNPLLSSFFSKTFSMLFTKKAEQDWFLYQQMCLQLLEYIKSQNNFLDLICKHFSTPVIPDLIMQMMKDVEGGQLKRNLYEWLTEDKLVERLIVIIGNAQLSDKHANVAEFLCDLIQQGRTMRQTEQENDSFEPAFDGSNPILKTIESESTIEALLNVILEPNAQESAIVSGISVVLTLLKPVVFVDEANSDRMKFIHNREKEIHEQILATVIRVIAPRLKDFHELLRNPPNKPEIVTTATKLSPPFGMTRLQICRVFTVLLQTKNEDVSKAICETDFFETLLTLFKQYCWNNFLHSEVEKCLQLIFYTQLSNNNNNSTQGSTVVNDGSFGKNSNNGDNNSAFFDFVFKASGGTAGSGDGDGVVESECDNNAGSVEVEAVPSVTSATADVESTESTPEAEKVQNKATIDSENEAIMNAIMLNKTEINVDKENTANATNEQPNVEMAEKAPEENTIAPTSNVAQETTALDTSTAYEEVHNVNDVTKEQVDTVPSALQTHVIINCKLISKLIDCWQHNRDVESANKGRRLGYMGHLIKIFKHITNCISESEHIGALIESSLSVATEHELWQSIINPNDGDFTKALATQSKMLANCNAHDAGDYSQHLPKDFITDNSTWDYIMTSNMLNNLGAFNDSSANFGRNIDDDDDDEDEHTGAGDGHALFGKTSTTTSALQSFGVTSNPWDSATDPLDSAPWAADFGSDNFADFDSHFSSFANDLGESLSAATREKSGTDNNSATIDTALAANEGNSGSVDDALLKRDNSNNDANEYDNNANVEPIILTLSSASEFGKFDDEDDDLDIGADADNDVLNISDAIENEKNEDLATKNLVRTLRAVMQDSEDDYEDDEGMWTKPLGSAAVEADVKDEQTNEAAAAAFTSAQNVFSNGPSKQATVTCHNELNDINDSKTTSTTSEPHAELTNDSIDTANKLTNCTLAAVNAAELAIDKKLAAAGTTAAASAVEIAPTTT